MKRGVFTRFQQWRERGEEGAALASVVILSFVILIIASSLSMTLVNAVNLTERNKAQLITFSSAESGTDYALYGAVANNCVDGGVNTEAGFEFEVYRSNADDAPSGLDDPSLSPGCPLDGDTYITIRSVGKNAKGNDTEIVSTYRWVIRNLSSPDGAVVAGTGLSNISQLGVYNSDGDLLIEDGSFDCNSSSNISGDVVVMNGNVRMSNACRIHGSVYASGNVYIDNNAAGVGGDVYTLGSFTMTTAATISGNVYAVGNISVDSNARINGNLTGMGSGEAKIDRATIGGSISTAGYLNIQNGTVINGNVLSSNIGPATIYGSTVRGDVIINGRFQNIQNSTMGGNISAAAPGQTSAITPDIVTPGWIKLGGNINTWNGGPQAAQGVTLNATIAQILPPSFITPPELMPDFFRWRDWDYVPTDWTSAGYDIEVMTDCNFQDKAEVRNRITSKTSPTVFDMRGCSEIKGYGVTLDLKTDIAFIAGQGLKSLEQVRINSAPGTGKHSFFIMVPDQVKDGNPSCVGGTSQSNSMNIWGLRMDTNMSGFFYTPCMVKFGGASELAGQIYTGNADYTAGGVTNFHFTEMDIPGFPVANGEDTPATFEADATERMMPALVGRSES